MAWTAETADRVIDDAELAARPGSGWDFSVPDWVERMKAGRSLLPDLPLNDNDANRAVALFNRFRLPDVIGTPRLDEAGGEWIRDIVRAVFGSLQPDGSRAVQDVFLLVPKKNSKSTTSAAIMLVAMMVTERPNAEFAIFGPTQTNSDIVFDAATAMVRADRDIRKLFHIDEHNKVITYLLNSATLSVLTFDPKIATGGKLAGWLLDEAHLLGSVHYAGRVVNQMRGARVARPDQFGIIITTQSDVPPAGFFLQELTYARKVRDGEIRSADYLAVLYEYPEDIQADEKKPWMDPAIWHWVNPNMGRSASIRQIQKLHREAEEKGAAEIQVWASQYLNIQIGVGLRVGRWTGTDEWPKAVDSGGYAFEDLLDRCEVVVAGVDGGGDDDLLGLAFIGREKGTGLWLHWGRAWADRKVLSLRKEIAPTLEQFAADDELTLFSGETDGAVDIEEIAALMLRVHHKGLFPERNAIGVDAAGIKALVSGLLAAGIPQDMICSISQGYAMSGNIKGLARDLRHGDLVHAGQALMAWSVGNARQELKGSNLYITKAVSGTAKIDPVIAMLNAYDLIARNPVAKGNSVYKTRGVRVV